MEVQKKLNWDKSYDFLLKKDNKTLEIMYGGTLDLYLSLNDGTVIPYKSNKSIDFDITKENYEVFKLFDELYNNIIDGKPYGKESECYDNNSVFGKRQHDMLVDENNNINWISDNGPSYIEDRFKFFKVDDDTYRFTFYRNDEEMDFGHKSCIDISVRIRNSGSSYEPYNCAFMLMFQKLQKIDTEYHQIHFEEVEYAKKLEKKRTQ